jgi:ribosomal protein S12 methylthiotransferase accessory factor
VNVGHGTHLSPVVAATRAITEAAQSRLTFIHGSREDMSRRMYDENNDEVYAYYDRIRPRISFDDFPDRSSEDLREDLSFVLKQFRSAGFSTVLRADLTRDEFQIPVVKVLVPGLSMYKH